VHTTKAYGRVKIELHLFLNLALSSGERGVALDTYENYSIHIRTPRQICAGDKIEKNEMWGECSAFGLEERSIQGFGGETWGKEATWETQV
jgi:hypothetical protein